MDAVKFLQERNRMYESGAATPSIGLEDDYDPVSAVKVVEQWAAAHSLKTRQSVFLEQYPKALLDKDSVLRVCPFLVGGDKPEKYRCICLTDCNACRREFWMQEVE